MPFPLAPSPDTPVRATIGLAPVFGSPAHPTEGRSLVAAFNPDQARDENGRFASDGSDGPSIAQRLSDSGIKVSPEFVTNVVPKMETALDQTIPKLAIDRRRVRELAGDYDSPDQFWDSLLNEPELSGEVFKGFERLYSKAEAIAERELQRLDPDADNEPLWGDWEDAVSRIVHDKIRTATESRKNEIMDALGGTRGVKAAALAAAYNPDQPRDERGRFGSGGGGAGRSDKARADRRNKSGRASSPKRNSNASRSAERLPKPAEGSRAASEAAKSAKADKWQKAAPKEVRAAVTRYQSDDYAQINKQLRGKGPSSKNANTVANLDKAFESATPIAKDLVATRHMNFAAFAASAKPGKEFTDKAFVSTTLNSKLEIPDLVSYGKKDFVSMTIKVPRGSKALYLPKNPNFDEDESELLLPRGAKFKILSVSKRDGGGIAVVAKFVGTARARRIAAMAFVEVQATLSRLSFAERFIWRDGDVEWDDVEATAGTPLVAASNPDQPRDDSGRFASDGGGASAGAHHAAFRQAREAYKAARQGAFSAARDNAKAAIAHADKTAVAARREHIDNLISTESSDKATNKFGDKYLALEERAMEYDEGGTPREKAESLQATRAAAKSAMTALGKVEPNDASDRLSQSDIDSNRRNLESVISKATAAIDSLKRGSAFAREARAIRNRDDEF